MVMECEGEVTGPGVSLWTDLWWRILLYVDVVLTSLAMSPSGKGGASLAGMFLRRPTGYSMRSMKSGGEHYSSGYDGQSGKQDFATILDVWPLVTLLLDKEFEV